MAEIDIVVSSGGAIDSDTAEDTVPSLNVEVRVVPASTVLNSAPLVGVGVSGGDGALGDAGNAIHLVGVVLTNAVEVKTSSVVLEGVGQVNNFSQTSLAPVRCTFFAMSCYLLTVSPQSAMMVGPGKDPLIN